MDRSRITSTYPLDIQLDLSSPHVNSIPKDPDLLPILQPLNYHLTPLPRLLNDREGSKLDCIGGEGRSMMFGSQVVRYQCAVS